MNAIVEEITPEVAELLSSDDDSLNPEDALNPSRRGELVNHYSPVNLELMTAAKELLLQGASPQLQRWQLLAALMIFDFFGKGHLIIPDVASFLDVPDESAQFVVEATIAKIAQIMPAAKDGAGYENHPLGSALIH